jgi:hypothetical protein
MIPDQKSPEAEAWLVHYGIVGMKWGIRKKETPEAKAARKAERKLHNKELSEVLDRRMKKSFGKGMTEDEYQRLSDKGREFAKGTELRRIVSGKNKDAIDRYVSTNQQDFYNYRIGLGRKFLGMGERHEVTLKAMKKLSSPSAKERVDAFVDLMDKPSIILANGKTTTGRELLKKNGYGRDARKLDSQRLGLKYYNDFLSNQYLNSPINTAYFKEISRRGYNSLIDDNDAGVLAREPLILLNPRGDVKRMSIKPLTSDDIKEAERYFRAP